MKFAAPPRPRRRLRSIVCLAIFGTSISAQGQTTTVIGWGFNNNGQANTRPITNVVAVAAGGTSSLALRSDGTVVTWGFPFTPAMPPGLNEVMALAAGRAHALAVQSNGTLVAWGENTSGQAQVPPGLSNIVAAAGAAGHSLAVRADGTVVAWGDNSWGQTNVPPGLSNVIAVSAGGNGLSGFSVALKSDGTVRAWGDNRLLQTQVPIGLSNVVAIAASPSTHTVALKSDGTVVVWGIGILVTNVPRGLSNVVAISAGSAYSLALRDNGTVVAWGEDLEGETHVPSTARNVTGIASGWFHNIAVVRSTPPRWPRIIGQPQNRRTLIGQPVTLSVTATSSAPVSYRWQFRGRDISGATNQSLRLDNPQLAQAGDYAVIVNADGLSVRSAPAFVAISPPPVAWPMTVQSLEDTEKIIGLDGADPDELPLEARIVSLPARGAVYQFEGGRRGSRIDAVPTPLLDPEWRIVFVPAPDDNGAAAATISFTVANEIGESAPATITVDVAPVNDAPTFVSGPNVEVLEDAGGHLRSGWASEIRAGPSNEAAQALTFEVTSDRPNLFSQLPAVSPNGTLTFLSAPNANGVAMVTVRLRDDGGVENGGVDATVPRSFTITILPVNDAPVADPATLTVDEDSSIAIVLGGHDVDGDSLGYSFSPPAHGTLSGTAPNLVYRPAPNYSGPDTFNFSVNDGQATSAAATIHLVVRPVNDPPTAQAIVSSPTLLSNHADGLAIVAPNNSTAVIVLDATRSADPEGDRLEYFWFESGATVPFATGLMVTNVVEIGSHTIALRVSDGTDVATTTLSFEVITPGEAVEEIISLLVDAPGLGMRRRPLVANLKAAIASLDRGNIISGRNQLEALENKVRAQLASSDPALALKLIKAARDLVQILAVR